jgi:hypothetical protein
MCSIQSLHKILNELRLKRTFAERFMWFMCKEIMGKHTWGKWGTEIEWKESMRFLQPLWVLQDELTPDADIIGNLIFMYVRKIARRTISFCVCPSVGTSFSVEGLVSHGTDFHEISYFRIFPKSVEKVHVLLKPDKNKGFFTWTPISIFVHVLPNVSYNGKRFGKNGRENQNVCFMFSFFPPKIVSLMR